MNTDDTTPAHAAPVPDDDSAYGSMTVDDLIRRLREQEMSLARVERDRVRLEALQISAINLIEDMDEARARAEEANRAKSEFVANVSHEMRTPMNGLLGFCDLLLGTELSGEQQTYVQYVKASADTLLSIINDVLDVSKIEAGRLELSRAPFDTRTAVRSAVMGSALQAQQKGLEVIVDISRDVPERVVGDAFRIGQVLSNLFGNAVKFTDAGEIYLGLDVRQGSDDEWTLQCTVRDSGIGVPEGARDKIFAAFTQADGSISRRYGGTGLGLTISREIAQAMGGRLWLEKRRDRGSEFRFTFRVGAYPESGAAAAPAPPSPLAGLRVLIVDDHETTLRVLGDLSHQLGMEPHCVSSLAAASEALDSLAETRRTPRVALVDAGLPGVAAWIREEQSPRLCLEQPIEIILLTSRAEAEPREGRAEWIAGYASKPVDRASLEAAVRAVLEPDTARKAPYPPRDLPPPSRRARILVVEDNEVNRILLRTILERRGHKVTLATTGEEAVRIAARARPDLIVMDVQMPGTDGLSATREIRRLEATSGRRTPVLALTANAQKGFRDECLEAGMDEYLAKPASPARAIETVERLLGLSPRLSADDREKPREGASAGAEDVELDPEHVLGLVSNDPEILVRLVEAFDAEVDEGLRELRSCLDASDSSRLARLAHGLKGSLSNFGPSRPLRLVTAMEEAALRGDLARAGEIAACLPGLLAEAAERLRGIKAREM